ncbi:MAG TPA: PfkB family carbohydrate kinase, partial [Armatimonadota bacterium]|nr:PfkB family carbohydrate kinase [Armatimonadota bacterium]
NLPGPEVRQGELDELCRRLDSVPDPACLLLGGSLPIGTPCEIYERLTASFKARGVRVFLDADGDPLRCGIRAKPYLIKPNEFEVADLVGERLRALEEYVEAAEKLAGQAAEVVVISLGEQGAIAANGKRVLRVRSPHVEPRSAVGAGDSMLGAMALSLSRGDSLENALCWGAAAGAAAVITPGTELCRPEDVRRLLPQVQVEELKRK